MFYDNDEDDDMVTQTDKYKWGFVERGLQIVQGR